ncbi:hypothetical protein [Streptomyces naphthomycinicus]|uniref:hypothetical protein n=1 Tax=Streptomyces naphthomycinicus TaxID=2872625 RepID=UPI001CEDD346|nr:hypothetical protein [Streptomyces sp. TML10]
MQKLSTGISKLLAAVGVGGLLLFTNSGTVQASPAVQPFTEQVRAANLSSEQATALQSEVDRHLRKLSGKQVSPNEIKFEGGRMLVAVPGEKYPRNFATGQGAQPLYDQCYDGPLYAGWFCEYDDEYYQGSKVEWYTCETHTDPFSGKGSWINNQTRGTRARMYDIFGSLIYTTPGSYSSDPTGDWTDVQSVDIC